MKKTMYLIFCILLIGIVEARVTEKEIEFFAKNLTGKTQNGTANNIVRWIEANIEYEFFWSARSANAVWITRRGDCTDKATLMSEMLYYNKIESRKIHGYCSKEKHDWIEAKINDSWIPYLDYECNQKGYGYW